MCFLKGIFDKKINFYKKNIIFLGVYQKHFTFAAQNDTKTHLKFNNYGNYQI